MVGADEGSSGLACEPVERVVARDSGAGRAGPPRPGAFLCAGRWSVSRVCPSSVPGLSFCCWTCVCLAGVSAALVHLLCHSQRHL